MGDPGETAKRGAGHCRQVHSLDSGFPLPPPRVLFHMLDTVTSGDEESWHWCPGPGVADGGTSGRSRSRVGV